MSSVDLKNDIQELVAVDVQAISSDTTTVGNIIDTASFESATFVQFAGALTDGNYTLLIEDGDDAALADAAAVADDFLIGTEAATVISAANGISRIGYVGKKRYVRASVVSDTVTTGATNLGSSKTCCRCLILNNKGHVYLTCPIFEVLL
jgi:hypothetical protein